MLEVHSLRLLAAPVRCPNSILDEGNILSLVSAVQAIVIGGKAEFKAGALQVVLLTVLAMAPVNCCEQD